jgi:hypothetical protein
MLEEALRLIGLKEKQAHFFQGLFRIVLILEELFDGPGRNRCGLGLRITEGAG